VNKEEIMENILSKELYAVYKVNENGAEYWDTVESEGNGTYYVVCSSQEAAESYGADRTEKITPDEILDRTLPLPNIKGVCVDPGSYSPKVVSKFVLQVVLMR
jgi:hypothetical protein